MVGSSSVSPAVAKSVSARLREFCRGRGAWATEFQKKVTAVADRRRLLPGLFVNFQNITFIDCLNIDGSFTLKRAQMCDGRPECWFGEDECIYECLLETNISSGHFCYLLKPGFGFTCNGKV